MRDAIDKLRRVASPICLTVVNKSMVFLSSFPIGLRGFLPRDFHPGGFSLTVSTYDFTPPTDSAPPRARPIVKPTAKPFPEPSAAERKRGRAAKASGANKRAKKS